MKLRQVLFILPVVLLTSFISCGKDDNSDFAIKESSGVIYVDGEEMPLNHKLCDVRVEDYYYTVNMIKADNWGTHSFTLDFKKSAYKLSEGDITNDILGINITNFRSPNSYIASGTITITNYDEKNKYITLRFDDVVFKDEKITSSVLSLDGEIKFPMEIYY